MIAPRARRALVATCALTVLLVGCHALMPLSGLPEDDAATDQAVLEQSVVEAAVTLDSLWFDTGAPVKTEVHTGEVEMSSDSQTVPLVISLDHAFVVCSFRSSDSDPYIATTCQLSEDGVEIRAGNPAASTKVRYHVVQHRDIFVQRGQAVLTEGQLDDPMVTFGTKVATGQSFVVASARVDETSVQGDEQRLVLAELEDSKTLGLYRGVADKPVSVEWQVVQWTGATVDSGSVSIHGDALSAVAPTDPVDLKRAFVVFSTKTDGTAKGLENVYAVRGRFQDNQSLVFDRFTKGSPIAIQWFSIQLPAGHVVVHGHHATVFDDTSRDEDLTALMDPTRSFPLHSCQLDPPQATVPSALDALACTTHLPSASQPVAKLRFQRDDDAGGDVLCAWSVVQVSP